MKGLPALRTRSLSQYAPIALRVVIGIIFIVHGSMKFTHIAKTISLFAGIGIPYAHFVTPAIAALEIVGGIALILGWGTRIFALLLMGVMAVAIARVKMNAGFVGGWEFDLLLL